VGESGIMWHVLFIGRIHLEYPMWPCTVIARHNCACAVLVPCRGSCGILSALVNKSISPVFQFGIDVLSFASVV
jgi:hypothetical protein